MSRHRLSHPLKDLTRRLKEQKIEIKRLYQLRQSRCAIWIKQNGIRQGQYLSGFKNIQMACRYKSQDIEDLQKNILKYHPLENFR